MKYSQKCIEKVVKRKTKPTITLKKYHNSEMTIHINSVYKNNFLCQEKTVPEKIININLNY